MSENYALNKTAREQLRAYRRRKEIPIGTKFFLWPGKAGYLTSGSLRNDLIYVGPGQAKAQVYTVCRIYLGCNGYGMFVDYWLKKDEICRESDPWLIINGPDAFRMTRYTEKQMTDDAVISMFAAIDCDIMDSWRNLISSTDIMRKFCVSRYKARKVLHRLLEAGMICRDRYGGQTEEGNAFCYHGYRITDKGRNTDAFRKEAYQQAKIAAECFSEGHHEMQGYYHVFSS